MVGVLLTILKILGIIILSIIGLVLLILALVLFVPIRYNAYGKYDKDILVSARVTWLLHFVSVSVKYTKELNLVVKILGIKIIGGKEKKPKKAKKAKASKKSEKLEADKKEEVVVPSESAKEIKDGVHNPIEKEDEPSQKDVRETKDETGNSADKRKKEKTSSSDSLKLGKEEKDDKLSLKERILKFRDDLVGAYQNIKKKILDTSKSVHDKVTYVCEMLKDEANRKSIGYLWNVLCKIIKHIWPRKHSIDVVYGNTNPALLADIVGYAASARAVTGINLNVVPVFDENVIKAEIKFKGHLRLIYILVLLIKVYANKNIRKFLKNFTS